MHSKHLCTHLSCWEKQLPIVDYVLFVPWETHNLIICLMKFQYSNECDIGFEIGCIDFIVLFSLHFVEGVTCWKTTEL